MVATVLYWFRRDLRLDDHAGLAAALATGAVVVPVFVVDPSMRPADMPSGSTSTPPATRAVLWRALSALDADLRTHGSRLICRKGDAIDLIPALARAVGATAVYATHKDGQAFLARDARVAQELTSMGCHWRVIDDATLVPADVLRTGSGKPYSVFTPFSRAWLAWLRTNEPERVEVPRERLALPPSLKDLPGTIEDALPDGPMLDRLLPDLAISADAAQRRLAEFTGVDRGTLVQTAAPITHYATQRDLPGVDGTSRLSAHLAWGTLSPRAAYLAALTVGRATQDAGREGVRVWVTELAWRDFYRHLLIHAPYAEHGAYQRIYTNLHWEGDPDHLALWQAGQTGYPIVDAAMRQLNQTGWMHNRARMIVASFLVKDLLLNWQLGEATFARRLIDYDIASNNGGWQWSASTGTDAQPYFRVFHPTSQGQRYDAHGAYVRHYVPELARVPDHFIHTPWLLTAAERRVLCPDYPPPIVDHARSRERAIAMFKEVRSNSSQ